MTSTEATQEEPRPIPQDQTAPQNESIVAVAGGALLNFVVCQENEVTLIPPIVIWDLALALPGLDNESLRVIQKAGTVFIQIIENLFLP